MAANYLYGVIRGAGPTSFGPIGLASGEEEVYSVGHGDLAAVVSDYSGPGLNELPRHELLGQLAIHQKVIERVMRERAILPAKFGTVLRGGTELRGVMGCGARQLSMAMEKFDSLVEYEVAATWELGPVFNEIAEEEEIATLRAAAAGMAPAESLSLRFRVGTMIKESLDRKREELGRRLTSPVAEHAVDHQANALMGDEMVMNVAFLVHRSAREGFLERLHQVDALLGANLNIRCIGPLPPYSFATVEIVHPDPAEVDAALQLLRLGSRISASAVRKAFRAQATKLHPDVDSSPEAKDRFSRLRGAEAALVAYCQGKAGGDGGWEDKICPAMREDVEQTYLVTIRGSRE